MRFISSTVFCLAAGLCLTSRAVAQDDPGPMLCIGDMVFLNPDASYETYALEVALSGQGYTITSRNKRSGETTVDTGACVDYWKRTCRHHVDWQDTDGQYYDFELRPVLNGNIAYTETWNDGAVGRTVLTCDTD